MESTSILSTLQRYWKYDHFRPLQEEAIRAILEGRDGLVMMPTGGGKSMVFQLPAVHIKGKVLVISPLISLMEDQVQLARMRQIRAAYIHGNMHHRMIIDILDGFQYGDLNLLYVSPERLQSELFISRIKHVPLSYLAIDEAHCISQWGYDFRPSYLKLRELKVIFPKLQIVAFTATATQRVRRDIIDVLKLQKPVIIADSFYRDNLVIRIVHSQNKYRDLETHLREYQNQSTILFRRSRSGVEELCSVIQELGYQATYYHAGMDYVQRTKAQRRWQDGECNIMVATNAFGMGIDKDNVRLVIHYDLPGSIEEYYQEIGRAGRDGHRSYCLLYMYADDIDTKAELIQRSKLDFSFIRKVYGKLCNALKLSEGSIMEEAVPFDIEQFVVNFNVGTEREVRGAFDILENEGYLQVTHRGRSKDKYEIQLLERARDKNRPNQDELLSSRVLEALFRTESRGDQKVTVSIYEWTRRFEVVEEEFKSALYTLERSQKIRILPSAQESVILVGSRVASKNLSFHYAAWKEQYRQKVLNFRALTRVLTDSSCRLQMIMSYFGETSDPCGHCDNCLIADISPKKLRERINEILGEQKMSLAEIIDACGGIYRPEHIKDALRYMYKHGQLKYQDETFYLNT